MHDDPPLPYHVTWSIRVLEELAAHSRTATTRGDGRTFRAAVEEFRRRLVVYPQFGDPMFNLKTHAGQVYNGIIPPLAMSYAVHEASRQVFVGALPVLLPRRQ